MAIKSSNPTNPKAAELSGSDFVIPSSATKKQANILIYGSGGSGKTSFVTRYAPHPVALLAYDRRYVPAVDKATKAGRIVYPCEINLPATWKKLSPDKVRELAQAALDKTFRNLEWAFEQSLRESIRTTSIDTGTELSEIMKLSFDGVLGQTKQGAYGRDKDYVNRKWWDIFNMARDSKSHLVVTSRAKEVWTETQSGQRQATGRYEPRCPDVINDAADWSGHIRQKKSPSGRLLKVFELEMSKCGANIAELGEVYTEKEWEPFGGPFSYACYMQFYDNSDLEDWQ